nr:hypothetical protein BaRGS_026872 [Batillaria attramentaria]
MSDKKAFNHRMSLNYTDQGHWLEIQRTTFKNWVNEQLRPIDLLVEELRTDFADGVNLVGLVEVLTGQGISGAVRKPGNQYQKLQNITVALNALVKDGVRIVNIDSSDIAEGNLKLILALVWLLVLRYQGGLTAAQHRRWILAWLRAVIPDCHVTNLTTDWNDGVALQLNNCRQAMKLARQHFDIPLTDWNNGAALADLVTSSGGNVPGWPDTQRSPKELLHLVRQPYLTSNL